MTLTVGQVDKNFGKYLIERRDSADWNVFASEQI